MKQIKEKPVQIEVGEWWYNGRFIQKTNHPKLSPYVSFNDNMEGHDDSQPHRTMKEAIAYCLTHAFPEAIHKPSDFIN